MRKMALEFMGGSDDGRSGVELELNKPWNYSGLLEMKLK